MHYLDFPFETGDLLMFGAGCTFLKAFTRTVYDHAGVVYRDPKTSQLFIYHMDVPGGFGRAMVVAHKMANISMSFQPLYRVLEKAQIPPIVRKLSPPFQGVMPIQSTQHLCFDNDIYTRKWGIYWPAVLPFVSTPTNIQKFTSCEEAVTRLYESMGVLHHVNRLMIINFFQSDWEYLLPLRSKYHFEPEVYLTKK